MLKKETVITIIDELYARMHIPSIIVDDALQPLYPEIAESLFTTLIPIKALIATGKPLIAIEDQIAAYATFPLVIDDTPAYLLCGCILNTFEGREDQKIPAIWKEFLPVSAILTHIASESLTSFQNFVKLLYGSLTHQTIHDEDFNIRYLNSKKIETTDEDILTLRRLIQTTPDYYHWELRFFEAFEKGEFNKLHTLLASLHVYDMEDVPTDIEDTKFKLVSFITILTRHAIKQGASIEASFSLSDLYLQKIKQLYRGSQATDMISEAIKEFYQLIRQSGSAHSYHVYQCIHYIDTHLYDKISLKTLAQHTNLSSSYLSALFKNEMKETMIDFIQRKKIEEAERLLLFTNKSYSEISSLLSFNSQSNFIQIFKKFKGMTPRQCQLEKRKNL